VICTTPRTGSWLLCGLLASTGVAGRPHEWFVDPLEQRNREAWNVATFAEYLERVRWSATTSNGVASLKVMWPTHAELLQRLRGSAEEARSAGDRELFERVFPDARYVWLVRDDVEAQAASWARALRTGIWSAWGSAAGLPPQRPDSEEVIAAAIKQHNASWRVWFEDNAIEPHIIRYGDLVEDPEGVAASVLRFLGVAPQPARVLTAPTPRID
jgi:LPS sulfotransferase NodH